MTRLSALLASLVMVGCETATEPERKTGYDRHADAYAADCKQRCASAGLVIREFNPWDLKCVCADPAIACGASGERAR